MNKKLLSILAIAATFIITSAVIVAIVIYFQPRTVFANSAQPVSKVDESLSAADIVAPTNTPAPKVQYPLVQKVKGVTMQVLGTANEGEYFKVDVCYDFPDKKEDWMLAGSNSNHITLSTPNQTISVYAIGIIDDFRKDSNGKFIGRCDHLLFPVSPDTNLDKLTLTISRMSTMMADIPDCAKAQKKLDDAKKNIKVKCADGSDHIGGFSVIEKPAEIDDATANSIAEDAFVDIVEGPWVFVLN